MVFAFEDDYAMGVLSSRTHEVWAMSRSSTIKGDPRYTNTSCFETFPWPYPVTDDQRKRVAEASRAVITRRHEICVEANIGLTALYNAVDEGAYTDLRAMHDELNEAVAAAYGWLASISHDGDEIVHRLLELNREIAAGTRTYDPFGAQAWAAQELLLRREGSRRGNRGDLPVPPPSALVSTRILRGISALVSTRILRGISALVSTRILRGISALVFYADPAGDFCACFLRGSCGGFLQDSVEVIVST